MLFALNRDVIRPADTRVFSLSKLMVYNES